MTKEAIKHAADLYAAMLTGGVKFEFHSVADKGNDRWEEATPEFYNNITPSHWRIKKEPTLVPYDMATFPRGYVVLRRRTFPGGTVEGKQEYTVLSIFEQGVQTGICNRLEYSTLFQHWEWMQPGNPNSTWQPCQQ